MIERADETFERHALDAQHSFRVGVLPRELCFSEEAFGRLWDLHPEAYHEILMHGRLVKTPRWQQAYGRDYHYTGRTNVALPVPEALRPIFAWARAAIDARLNGLLLNWYDDMLGHSIGKHRDSIVAMIRGAPIVTVSLGGARLFRLRPWKGEGKRDFEAKDGAVFIMPYDTNRAWTHEVPALKRFPGRRISITLRAFEGG